MSRFYSPSLFTRPARVTFKIKSGVCSDGARFIQETLNTINPTYEAHIVYFESPFRLQRGHNVTHAVCSFKVDGKLYYMDYATPNGHTMGTFGPFDSLKNIEVFYASHTGGGIVGYYVIIKNDQLIRDDGPRFFYKGKLFYKGE